MLPARLASLPARFASQQRTRGGSRAGVTDHNPLPGRLGKQGRAQPCPAKSHLGNGAGGSDKTRGTPLGPCRGFPTPPPRRPPKPCGRLSADPRRKEGC